MTDCARCGGDGEIETDIRPVDCPNCRDVCQWCNQFHSDMEPLGETGLSVCRPCIRDMAGYKEDGICQLYVWIAVNDIVDDPGQLRVDLADAAEDTFEMHGINMDAGEWDVREADE